MNSAHILEEACMVTSTIAADEPSKVSKLLCGGALG